MEQLAKQIFDVIRDYRNDDGIQIAVDDIIEWASQFGNDSQFVLAELAHLMPQIYFSKERVRGCLKDNLNTLYKLYNYKDVETFLNELSFIHMQGDDKSQTVLLGMLDGIVHDETGRHLGEFANENKSLFVYVDDVLGSGGTIGRDLISWLSQENRIVGVCSGQKHLAVMLLCAHSWGLGFQQYRIMKSFPGYETKKILWGWNYEIQNHLKLNAQSLNIAIPINDQPTDVRNYLSALSATKYEDYAYREAGQPPTETFFTSPENRIRYENILLTKGIEIIGRMRNPGPNVRPLGFTNPNYKTYGLGTHFFTWRNIPNNSPLVFWWDIPEHGWKPLFPPKRKG